MKKWMIVRNKLQIKMIRIRMKKKIRNVYCNLFVVFGNFGNSFDIFRNLKKFVNLLILPKLTITT